MTDQPRIAYEVSAPLEERLESLRELYPEVFSEAGIDFEKLKTLLGDEAGDAAERYSFGWAGKRDAVRLLQVPSRASLAPSRPDSVDFDTTQHVFIEGENLETLKLLRKAYAGRVKMIYIDPPTTRATTSSIQMTSRTRSPATCSSPARLTLRAIC